MGKIIVSEFMTLDGVIEAPGGEKSLGEHSGWTIPFFCEEIATFKLQDFKASDALLMGRTTYEIHAASWPSVQDEMGMADLINALPKYVVSTTLERLEWNNSRLINKNILDEIRQLKQSIKRDILIDGGSSLVHTLQQHGLIDEFRLLVCPVVLGEGKRLFQPGGDKLTLRLVEARTFSTMPIGQFSFPHSPRTKCRSEWQTPQ